MAAETTRKTIVRLDTKNTATLTKDEEIAFLNEVTGSIPAGSYLASLFSRDFVTWVECQIRNDFSPDLYGNLSHTLHEARKTENELRSELRSAEHRIGRIQADLNSMKEYSGRVETALAEAKAQRAQDHEAWSRDSDRVYKAEAALREAQAEIVSLKAKLYDLMTAQA